MIYVDTSVVLAQLLAEDVQPSDDLWASELVSSRLLEYEVWSRIHAGGLGSSHTDTVRHALAGISFMEMDRSILVRLLHPFPIPVRTLDAIHLASAAHLLDRGVDVSLATYDRRMRDLGQAIGMDLYPL